MDNEQRLQVSASQLRGTAVEDACQLIDELVRKTNELMAQGRQVNISYKSREAAMQIPAVVKLAKGLPESIKTLRLVEIEGIDLQADGGTHVKNTSEIGSIVIERLENKGKNNRRIYFSLATGH